MSTVSDELLELEELLELDPPPAAAADDEEEEVVVLDVEEEVVLAFEVMSEETVALLAVEVVLKA